MATHTLEALPVPENAASWRTRVISQIEFLARKLANRSVAVSPEELALRSPAEFYLIQEYRARDLLREKAKAHALLVDCVGDRDPGSRRPPFGPPTRTEESRASENKS